MKQIAQYFNHPHQENPDPRILQQNIIFNILYFFVRRGRENLHAMEVDWFRVVKDPNTGTKHIEQIHDELDKNYGPQDTHLTNEGRMYEQPGMSKNLFYNKTLFSHLSKKFCFIVKTQNTSPWILSFVQVHHSALSQCMSSTLKNWTHPALISGRIHSLTYEDAIWFEGHRVGHSHLEKFMSSLSKMLHLSQPYTNHCIHATGMTLLNEQGFEAHHICALSSHKNESTVCNYTVRCPEPKKRQMYDTLAQAITAPAPPQKKKKKKRKQSANRQKFQKTHSCQRQISMMKCWSKSWKTSRTKQPIFSSNSLRKLQPQTHQWNHQNLMKTQLQSPKKIQKKTQLLPPTCAVSSSEQSVQFQPHRTHL